MRRGKSSCIAPCTINFDVPSQILQANNFGAPLSQFVSVVRGTMTPWPSCHHTTGVLVLESQQWYSKTHHLYQYDMI